MIQLDDHQTVIDQQPQNINLLSPENFRFFLKRAPSTNYFLQKLVLPGVKISPIRQATPFADIWQPGEQTEFNPLVISFKVDEDLINYFEIVDWLTALGEEEEFQHYARLKAVPQEFGKGVTSEIIITLLDSARNPNIHFYYHKAFPYDISDIMFDTTPGAIAHATATVAFRFTDYDWERVVKA